MCCVPGHNPRAGRHTQPFTDPLRRLFSPAQAKAETLSRKLASEQAALVASTKRFHAELRAKSAAVENAARLVAAVEEEVHAQREALARRQKAQVGKLVQEVEARLAEKEEECSHLQQAAKENSNIKNAINKLLQTL